VEWVAQDASGLSGGMLTIWNSATFKFLNSFSGYGFLGIKVEREGVVLYVVNVYSPCHISGKIRLWEELLSFKQQSAEGEWCVRGDSNAVLFNVLRTGPEIEPLWPLVQGSTGRTGSTAIEPFTLNRSYNFFNSTKVLKIRNIILKSEHSLTLVPIVY
jgi:hypothetical protein